MKNIVAGQYEYLLCKTKTLGNGRLVSVTVIVEIEKYNKEQSDQCLHLVMGKLFVHSQWYGVVCLGTFCHATFVRLAKYEW